MVFMKPFIVALFAVVLLDLAVGGLLVVHYKLCFDAGSSPSVTSAPDPVFS